MGRTTKGKRDGTGPHKDSYQKSTHSKGKRQQNGAPCPVKKK